MEELHVECLALLKLDAASLGEAQMIESKSLAIKVRRHRQPVPIRISPLADAST